MIMINESKLIKEVLAVERDWAAAHQSMDLDILSSILGDNYRQIQPGGSVIGREELLNSYLSGNRKWEVARSDNHEIRILGDVALLIGRWRGIGENSGEEFDYSARFLAVYQRVKGKWKLVSDVSIPIEEI
jgi:ketosteroid isomerase-like protein